MTPTRLPTRTERIEKLKPTIDLRLYIQNELGKPNSKSSRGAWIFSCPFHRDDTASFAVYADHYHCFGACTGGDNHGDIFNYIQRRLGVTLDEALAFLGEDMELPKFAPRQPIVEEKPKIEIPFSEIEAYHYNIHSVMPYLQQRKIPQSLIDNRMIGAKTFRKTYVDLTGIRWNFEYNRVALPYLFEGKVYALNFRRDDISAMENMKKVGASRRVPNLFRLIKIDLAEKAGHNDPDLISDEKVMIHCFGSRFYRPSGTAVTAYGVQNLLFKRGDSLVYPKRPHVILAEGEFDQLSGESEGYISLALKSVKGVDIPRLLQNVRLIYIAVDPDEAGIAYATSMLEALHNDKTRVRMIHMDRDMNDLHREGKLSTLLSKKPFYIDPVL